MTTDIHTYIDQMQALQSGADDPTSSKIVEHFVSIAKAVKDARRAKQPIPVEVMRRIETVFIFHEGRRFTIDTSNGNMICTVVATGKTEVMDRPIDIFFAGFEF